MILKKAKFIIASGPVIIENNKVLLNRHGNTKEDRKYWKFVGGRVEEADFEMKTDLLEETCKREVREEMGIGVKDLKAIKPMMIKHPEKENTIVILIHYLAKRIGEINAASEIVEWKWFDINKLPENCAPNIRPVIEKYNKCKTW